MKLIGLLLLIIVLAFACTQRPAPLAADTKENTLEEGLAIAVEYVGVPTMEVRPRAALDAPVIASYGFTEAISILEVRGDWKRIRTFDGTGWVRASECLTAEQIGKIDLLVPRFYVKPVEVPAKLRGEIAFQAKVNTDGEVNDVQTIMNTTGSQKIADANAAALKEAKFYPIVDKGSRKTFTYEHRVYY